MSTCWGCVVAVSTAASMWSSGQVVAFFADVSRKRAFRAIEEEETIARAQLYDGSFAVPVTFES